MCRRTSTTPETDPHRRPDMTDNTSTDDPLAVFEPTEAAIAADARKLLRRAGVFSPTAEQTKDARESAAIQYRAQAEHALKTGKVI